MGRVVKKLIPPKSDQKKEEEKNKLKPSNSPIVLISDDDDKEANEDLSLKIVAKPKIGTCSTSQNDAVLVKSRSASGGGGRSVDVIHLSPPPPEVEVVTVMKDDKKKKKIVKKVKKKTVKVKKKIKKTETQSNTVDVAKEEEDAEICKPIEIDKQVETNPVEISDNTVLRKLLRGPRYFDPPDDGWGTCYNCGEEGHTTVNCTSAKRKKPCFVCGSLEHNAKQCTKRQDCFICKKGGHRAKNCTEKNAGGLQSAKICLKCGKSGHEMFSCKNDYAADDLKEIQCYICKSFRHLCCVNYTATGPRDVSCYRCGQSGHTGLACTTLRGETTSTGSLGSCYNCGEEGHFARECTSSVKFAKRNRELSTPTSKKNIDSLEARSVARDLGKACKRKKTQYEAGLPTSSKSKSRQNKNIDSLEVRSVPHDLGKARKTDGWRSPATPSYKSNYFSDATAGGHASSSHSSNIPRQLHFGNSAANVSAQFYQHRFSVSSFGNSSSDGVWRNYGWYQRPFPPPSIYFVGNTNERVIGGGYLGNPSQLQYWQ